MSVPRVSDFSRSIADALQVFESSGAPADVTPGVLEVLAHAANCEWAMYWKVDGAQHVLRPAATWRAPTVASPQLERDTAGRMLTLSEGTAGHVWRTRKPIWTTDLVRDMCLPRSLDAKYAGLAGGIWFAVKTDEVVYGVIELLGRDVAPSGEALLVEIEHLGILLGRAVQEHERARGKSQG